MKNLKDKTILGNELGQSFNEVFHYCTGLSEEQFFGANENKWSIAENIHHLILSTSPLIQALNLPKIVIASVGGKSKRASSSYNELVESYQQHLKEGGKATGKYVPKDGKKYSMAQSLSKYQMNGTKLIKVLQKWTEEELDQYLLPHPLLGKITVREMLYFSVYHNFHHLKAIKN